MRCHPRLWWMRWELYISCCLAEEVCFGFLSMIMCLSSFDFEKLLHLKKYMFDSFYPFQHVESILPDFSGLTGFHSNSPEAPRGFQLETWAQRAPRFQETNVGRVELFKRLEDGSALAFGVVLGKPTGWLGGLPGKVDNIAIERIPRENKCISIISYWTWACSVPNQRAVSVIQ